MLHKGIADFIASCGLEAEDLPAPDKLVLSPRLLGAQRRRCCNRRCGNQCKGGYHEQYLVHGNLRGLRRSIVSCRNLTLAPYCARAARGQARKVELEARACPLRQLLRNLQYLPHEPAVTAVTGYSSNSPLFFGRRAKCEVAHHISPGSP